MASTLVKNDFKKPDFLLKKSKFCVGRKYKFVQISLAWDFVFGSRLWVIYACKATVNFR